ncbi:class C beta-lactamase [Mesorhizobium retamae]
MLVVAPASLTVRIFAARVSAACLLLCPVSTFAADGEISAAALRQAVDEAIIPLMKQQAIAGMAVAVTVNGNSHFFGYGVASKESGRKVTKDTIFEIGSISKIFTATLGAYAAATDALALDDKAVTHWPELGGSAFERISLLELGTYSAGGLPLQFPEEVSDNSKMLAYYRAWRPEFGQGIMRLYSNPSIGLFGHLSARAIGEPFEAFMEGKLAAAFGLNHTFVHVPADRMENYAQGYTKQGQPVRVSPGALDAEAYGIKTTAPDLLRLVEANIDGSALDRNWAKAVSTTQAGYYRAGSMIQGLGWEMYDRPVELDTLLQGNSADMALKPRKTEPLARSIPQDTDRFFNKTGATRGFGGYVAFIPKSRVGIVLLANTNYPNEERVKAAHRILQAVETTLP